MFSQQTLHCGMMSSVSFNVVADQFSVTDRTFLFGREVQRDVLMLATGFIMSEI